MMTRMKKLFGTDGMRGEAGRFPLDAATVRTAGRSLARHLSEKLGRAPRIVMGRDTRESGTWIEAAFIEGAHAASALAESAGVITTPGVAYLARTLPADAGVVISASHNPFHDNGIKIFAPDGRKLDDSTERLIEADIYAEWGINPTVSNHTSQSRGASEPLDEERAELNQGSAILDKGDAEDDARHSAGLRSLYLDYLSEEVAGGLSLEGLSVVVDCAHGAAYELAPALLARLGARVVSTFDEPDGRNINRDCGSLHTDVLCRRVIAEGAHLGVAYDGDADRALFVDGHGQLVDGDATLWVLAGRMHARGELAGERVVATVMSNIGLELALRSRGIELVRTDVGDKYVLEELLRTGSTLGGEQSGHIIFPRLSLAGDGMITTICLLRTMREAGCSLEELTEGFTRYPQVLVNVRVREKTAFERVEEIAHASAEVRARLGERGRLLLRYSGTEPLARVMIEGQSQKEIDALAAELADVIRRRLGAA
ncbi:MAG: phosphoglucosamine mutase [Acidobacteriota bacterium]|jgi:phosphoglucosamine mutase|nr:phosphoglucosamine mutase [Acidobacteriota bacterium]